MTAPTVATGSDDRRDRLVVLRDQLATAIEAAEPNMLPQLAGQYRATLAELAAMPVVQGKVPVKDDLKDRRARRVAKATTTASSRRAK